MKIKFITKLISAACAATMVTSAVAMPVGAINEKERGQISDNANLFDYFQGQAYYAGINDPNYLSKIRCNIGLINKYEKELEGCLNMIRQLKTDAYYARFRPNRTYNYVLLRSLLKFAKDYGEALEWWNPSDELNQILRDNDQSSRLTIFNIANKLKRQLDSRISDGEYRNLYGALDRLEILLINDGIYFADVRANANRALSEYMEAKGAIDLFYDWQAKEVAEKLDKEDQIAEDKEMAEQLRIEEQIRQEVAEQYGIEEQIKENEKTKKEVQIAKDEKLAQKEQAKADEETKKEVQIARDEEFAIEAQLNELGDSAANYPSYEEAKKAAAGAQKLIMDQIEKDRSKALLNQVRGGGVK